jgi:hypothetical protein
MLAACLLIINPWGQGGRKLGDLYLSLGCLNAYEIALIAIAIFLFRSGRAVGDVPKLIFVEFMFLLDAVLLTDSFAISGGDLRFHVLTIGFVAAIIKLVALRWGLSVRFETDVFIFAVLCLIMTFAAPSVLAEQLRAGADCQQQMFFLWAAFSGLLLLFCVLRYLRNKHWKEEGSLPFWRLLYCMAIVMGIIHLVAMGEEFSSGLRASYITPILCVLPLALRTLIPSMLQKKHLRVAVDAFPAAAALFWLVVVMSSSSDLWLHGDKVVSYSYWLTLGLAFAVYGILYLKERNLQHLISASAVILIAGCAPLTSRAEFITGICSEALLLITVGASTSFLFSLLFIRIRNRWTLAALVGSLNLMIQGGIAQWLGNASLFSYIEWTGLTILLLEFVLWLDTNPVFRNIVMTVLLFVGALHMCSEYTAYTHLLVGAQASGFLALTLVLHLRRALQIAVVGSLPPLFRLFSWARPETLRGWGILLAICALCILALGFLFSLKRAKIESQPPGLNV